MLREIEGVGTSQSTQPNEKVTTQKQISDQRGESEAMGMVSGEGGGATGGGDGAADVGAGDDAEEGGATIMTAAQKKAAKKEREKKKKEAARQARLAQQNKQERATNDKEERESPMVQQDGSKSHDEHDEQVSVKCESTQFQEVQCQCSIGSGMYRQH